MSSEVLVDALIAATGVMIIAWLASLAMRRAPAALRNSVWRAALVGLWLSPALVIAGSLLHVQPRELAVPVLLRTTQVEPERVLWGHRPCVPLGRSRPPSPSP